MPQQIGKFDFSGIPPAGAAQAQPPAGESFDFTGVQKTQPTPQGRRVPFKDGWRWEEPGAERAAAPLFQTENLPLVGATIGGTIGAGGGTAFGLGFGGIPGAVGGASLGGGFGESLRQLIDRFTGKPAPATPAAAAADIGTEGAIQGAAELAGGAITKGAGKVATATYRGYLKPALNSVDLPKAREIVQTALREGLTITKGGEERAGRLITELNKQVGGLLEGAKGVVDLHQVAEKVRAFAKSKYYKPGVDLEDFKAANEVADLIDQHPSLGLPAGAKPTRVEVTPTQANEVKQAVRPNSRAYGQRGATPEAESRKYAGHVVREELEAIQPSIAPLNNRERQLIDAADAVTRATGREENRNLLFGVPSLLSMAGGTAAYASDQDPIKAAIATIGARVGLDPAVASRGAILAHKFSKVPGTGVALAVRMGLVIAMRELEQQQGQ